MAPHDPAEAYAEDAAWFSGLFIVLLVLAAGALVWAWVRPAQSAIIYPPPSRPSAVVEAPRPSAVVEAPESTRGWHYEHSLCFYELTEPGFDACLMAADRLYYALYLPQPPPSLVWCNGRWSSSCAPE